MVENPGGAAGVEEEEARGVAWICTRGNIIMLLLCINPGESIPWAIL